MFAIIYALLSMLTPESTIEVDYIYVEEYKKPTFTITDDERDAILDADGLILTYVNNVSSGIGHLSITMVDAPLVEKMNVYEVNMRAGFSGTIEGASAARSLQDRLRYIVANHGHEETRVDGDVTTVAIVTNMNNSNIDNFKFTYHLTRGYIQQ